MYKVIWRQFSELICGIERETDGQATITSWEDNNVDNDDSRNNSGLDEFQFHVKICPKDGPYAHAEFEFEIIVRFERYGEMPAVRCLSHIYHPNIEDYDNGGGVCLNLFHNWNIEMGLKAIIDGLLFLFSEPNEEDPINERFIIPPGCTFEDAVTESLQGGSYLHYSGPPNRPWCKWYEEQMKNKRKSLIVPTETNKICENLKENIDDHYEHNHHHHDYPGKLGLLNNQDEYESTSDKQKESSIVEENDTLTSSFISSSSSSLSSAVSLPHAEKNPTHQSNLFNTRQLSNHQSFSTIIWKEISIISVDIDDLTEITYHFIETCNFEWNKHCEKVYYGHLNIGIPDIFTTDIYQKSVYQSISLKSKCTENIQNNVNAQFDHFNSNDNNKDNGRSVISTISKAVFTNESMYVRSIVPMKWIYYTTRWSNYLVPGRQLTENFLKPNWASPYRRASSRQLFEDLHRYILNVEWPHASQIFILDPLALSPFSPIALRIIYDHNEPKAEKWIYVYEWLSPWYSVNKFTISQNRNRYPGIAIICWLAYITNWINYLSRYEINHTQLGYSRPGTTIFSRAWRFTEPIGTCYIFSHSLTCGQIAIFDGWILWLSGLVMQQITSISLKLLDYINKKYRKYTPPCRLSSTKDPLKGCTTSMYVFTDVDEI
uniref:UBC core domain-containing protein n=1 Tax=Trichobilharzia regenti TaxID=157069 RepID=A0AA85JYG8_TRIRE|nr:unnamed protein product [Trichobilharzia regenti]